MVYRGPNAAESFLEAMQEEERRFKEILKNPKDMVMTPEDWRTHRSSVNCQVCDQPLVKTTHRDAEDMYGFNSGKYKGLVHRTCGYKS